jgi:hypothetical protein
MHSLRVRHVPIGVSEGIFLVTLRLSRKLSGSIVESAASWHLDLGDPVGKDIWRSRVTKGNWIRIEVQSSGAFTITNGRNNFSKSCVALAR